MKKIFAIFSIIFTSIFMESLLYSAYAQRLPKVQEANMFVSNVKIDGKTDEWNNKFQAYNPLDRIYYTIANNEANLYLVLATDNTSFQEKAVHGITFTLNFPAENGGKSKETLQIRFPAELEPRKIDILSNTASTVRHLLKDTSAKAKRKVDSLIRFANLTIDNSFKEIEISGIKQIDQNQISIYNDLGISVLGRFNYNMQYVCEMSIPLKYLSAAINHGAKFTYNIKINGPRAVYSNGSSSVHFDNPGQTLTPEALYQNYPTDFSGEYTLAKAP